MPIQFPDIPRLSYQETHPLEGIGNQIVQGLMTPSTIKNAIAQAELQKVKAQYAPVTTLSEAASKLAYANLMGPQFISKLMSNPRILANMPEDVKNNLLPLIVNAGSSQGFGNPALQTLLNNQRGGNNLGGSGGLGSGSLGGFGGAGNEGSGGGSYNPPAVNQGQQIPQGVHPSSISSAFEQTYPQGQNQNQSVPRTPGETWEERYGRVTGVEKELEEGGKYRAEDIRDFGKQYEKGLTLSDKFDELGSILTNPVFKNMRTSVPFFQDKQLKVLSKIGTKEEQNLIGNFFASTQEVVRETINSFSGNRLKSEADIARDMKISDNDTWDVMMGKLESAMLYKDLSMKRASLASDIMEKYHISKKKALEAADRQIDGKKVREDIDKKLHPPKSYKSLRKPIGQMSKQELQEEIDNLRQ